MLTRDDFVGLMEAKFDVQATDGRHAELALAEVSDLKQLKGSEHFSLLFRGPLDAQLGQGIHQFNCEGAENMELFIVPVGVDANGFLYESIFNRIRQAED